MEMSTRSYLFLFIASSTFLLLLLPGGCEGGPVCASLNEVVPEMLPPCRHGVVMDWCGNARCAKGPGETCGGRWNERGTCGKGMYCVCGYCAGCTRDLQCALGRFC